MFNIVNSYYATIPTGAVRVVPTPSTTSLISSNQITMNDITAYSFYVKDSSNKVVKYDYIAVCKHNNIDSAEIYYLTIK